MNQNINKKFRSIKREIRILGVDDAPFTPHTTQPVMLIATVFRAGHWLDGVIRTYIMGDGRNSTHQIIIMVNNTRHKDQLGVIMLDGITFGGFNIANIRKIFEATRIPVIIIMRKYPNLAKIEKALKRFPDWKERWNDVLDAGEIYKIKNENKDNLYIQICGIDLEDAEKIIKLSSTRSDIPEPLRAAHIIAAGVITGESKGNA